MTRLLALLLLGLIFPDTHIWRLYVAMELPEPLILVPVQTSEWNA